MGWPTAAGAPLSAAALCSAASRESTSIGRCDQAQSSPACSGCRISALEAHWAWSCTLSACHDEVLPAVQVAVFTVLQLPHPSPEQPYIKGLLDPCTNSMTAPNIPAEKLYDKKVSHRSPCAGAVQCAQPRALTDVRPSQPSLAMHLST